MVGLDEPRTGRASGLDKGSFVEMALVLDWSESSGSFDINALVNREGDVQAFGVRPADLKIRAFCLVD